MELTITPTKTHNLKDVTYDTISEELVICVIIHIIPEKGMH
jgi:hypothetical protein